jgi:hypothetical protein
MSAAFAIAVIGACAATFWPLRRLLRASTRPTWLANPVNAEYVMLMHLSASVVGVCLLIDAVVG